MKRFLPLFLAFIGCLLLAGCPGGEESADGGGDGNPTADGGQANGGGPTAQFPQGVDSGRAEDGSDEDK